MKKVLIGAVGCLVLVGFIYGCGGARYEVAKENVLAKIDKLLGETDVQKKEVEIQIAKARKAVETLTEAKIKAQVNSEQMSKKVTEKEEEAQKLKGYLATLREHLSSDQPVVLAGKTYSKDELKTLADKVIKQHNDANTKLESLKRNKNNIDMAATSLGERQNDTKEKLVALENRVKEFDAKIDQLKALKDARKSMGDADQTLAASLEQLERQIDDLHAKTETQLRLEEERWKSINPRKELDEVERIMSSSKGTDSTLSEIDKILGKK